MKQAFCLKCSYSKFLCILRWVLAHNTAQSCTLNKPTAFPSLTSRHHNVCCLHCRFNVLLKGWLHKFAVLLDDTCHVPPTFHDVPLQPPHKPDIWVCVHKNFHVQKLQKSQGREKLETKASGQSLILELIQMSASLRDSFTSYFPQSICDTD